MAAPFEVNLEQTNIVPREKTLFGVFGAEGSIGTVRRALLPSIDDRPDLYPSRRWDLRAFAKKAGYKIAGVWKETGSGAEDDRAERKKILVLAQAREIDAILVTELTRWDPSMLDLPHPARPAIVGRLPRRTQGLQFDLRSAQGKLIFASELLNEKPSGP